MKKHKCTGLLMENLHISLVGGHLYASSPNNRPRLITADNIGELKCHHYHDGYCDAGVKHRSHKHRGCK